MNILASIASLLSRFTRAATPNPAPSASPVLPPPPPEPSCFVKGLIRSIRTEPQNWERRHIFYFYWSHQTQDICLSEDAKYYRHNSTFQFSDYEARLLVRVIQEHLVGPMEKRMKLEAQRESDTKREYFEKLGCPDKST